MSLRSSLHRIVASQDELVAGEELAESLATGCTPVAHLTDRHRANVSGVLRSVTVRPREGVRALEAEMYDGSGVLELVWLGRREIAGIEPGRRLRVEGMVCERDGRRTIFNPCYELRPRS